MREFLLLVLLVTLSCQAPLRPASPQQSNSDTSLGDDAVITKRYVEIGGLWGREYELTIRSTGEVVFRGKIGLRELGSPERWEVSRSDIARLAEAFDRANFYQLREEHGRAFDNASSHDRVSTVSLVNDGKSKTVSRHLGNAQQLTPEEQALGELEMAIIRVARAESRIRQACALQDASDIP